MRTRIVAQRMEFAHPLVGGAFCDVLGPTLLVGAMHVVHYGAGALSSYGGQAGQGGAAGDAIKVKYLGLFLYQTHLVMAKVKKRASYEPREWLPLRMFDAQNLEEGQGSSRLPLYASSTSYSPYLPSQVSLRTVSV
jgi:hypothetical protein